MDQMKRIRLASNSFYNIGLERAKIRDLTGAVTYLQRCLNLNKYHTEARNLLGLIYYEMGEVSDALLQWVISMNFNESGNRADYYLEQIQRKPDRLETASQNVKKYNLALSQARSGSDDLAVLQLTRVVESNPKFIKAQLLLALLYISHEDYTKAGKFLYKVLKIDRNNPKASWYMSIVKARTGKAEVEKKKSKNAFSHRQMQDDDVIIPPSYKENTGWQSILNIGAGLLLGAAAVIFLVMPAKEKALNNTHTAEITQFNEQLSQKNGEIDKLNKNMGQYIDDKAAAEDTLNTLLTSNDSVENQYAILVKMLDAYSKDDLTGAVTLYGGFNPSLFTDEAVINISNGLKQDIETNGYQTLEDLAYTMWSAGRLSEALNYYQICLNIRPENPKVLYSMGMISRAQNQTETAIQLFTQVVTQFATSEYAPKSQTQLSELQPQGQPAAAPGEAAGQTGGQGEGNTTPTTEAANPTTAPTRPAAEQTRPTTAPTRPAAEQPVETVPQTEAAPTPSPSPDGSTGNAGGGEGPAAGPGGVPISPDGGGAQN